MVSTTSLLFVQFIAYPGLDDVRFNATYNLVCGDFSLTGSGYFSSFDLDHDGLYDTNINCTWVIEVETYELIKLTITYLDIQELPSGDCDTIQV